MRNPDSRDKGCLEFLVRGKNNPMKKAIKRCVYCREEKEVTRDHVISKALFPKILGLTHLLEKNPESVVLLFWLSLLALSRAWECLEPVYNLLCYNKRHNQ